MITREVTSKSLDQIDHRRRPKGAPTSLTRLFNLEKGVGLPSGFANVKLQYRQQYPSVVRSTAAAAVFEGCGSRYGYCVVRKAIETLRGRRGRGRLGE
jgi:hypothetical protein